jgi:HSP20 family protein
VGSVPRDGAVPGGRARLPDLAGLRREGDQGGVPLQGGCPGIADKDLEVTLTGNRLTVCGKREAEKEDKSERYYTYERNYGAFSRSFTLPDGADFEKLQASLESGVLAITVPKKPEIQPKKIAVKSEGQPPKS